MKKRLVILFSVVIALLLAFAGCSTADNGGNYAGGAAPDNGGGVEPENAKIIKTAYMDVETDKFDDFITTLYATLKEYSAYTDSERFSGSDNMIASITIRVPADDLDALKEVISDNSGVLSYSASKQDITLQYETLVARSETLTQEVSVLETLFEDAREAGNFSAVAEIEKRMTEVKKELAETNAQLAVYDNRVAYSTLHLTVTEVSVVTDEKEGAFVRIGNNIKNGFVNVWIIIVEVFVFLISAIPYLLLIGVVVAAVLIPIFLPKKLRKKREQKALEEQNSKTEEQNEDNE